MRPLGNAAVVCAACAVAAVAATAGCKTPGAAAPTSASPAAVARAAALPPPAPPPLPDLALGPAEAARARLAVTVAVASPFEVAADLDAVMRRLQLEAPLGQSFIDQLVSGSGVAGVPVTRAQLERLDRSRPITAAGLVGPQQGLCVAVPFNDAAGARRTLEEIGPEAERRGAASARRLPSGAKVWAGISGRTLLLSRSEAPLAAAGALAIAEQTAPRRGQAAVTIEPAVLGPVGRAAIETTFAKAMAEAFASEAAPGRTPTSPSLERVAKAVPGMLARLVAQTHSVRLALEVNEQAGLAVRAELEPTADSALGRRLATPTPYTLDPSLPVEDDGTLVGAWGTLAGISALVAEIARPTGRAGRALSAALEAYTGMLAGPGSCTILAGKLPLQWYCAHALKPGLKAPQVLRRYAAMMETYHAWIKELDGRSLQTVKVRRGRDVLEIETAVEAADPAARAMRELLAGGPTQLSAVTVRGNRLLVTQGDKPRELLAVLERAPAPRAPTVAPILEATLARTRGADALFYVDVVSLILRITQVAQEPAVRQAGVMLGALAGMARLHAPFVVTARSAGPLTYELQLPYESLEAVAGIVRRYTGVMGAPAK